MALVEEEADGIPCFKIQAEAHLVFRDDGLERQVAVSFEEDGCGSFCILEGHASAEDAQGVETEGSCPLLPFPLEMGEQVGRLEIEEQVRSEALDPAARQRGDSVGGGATGFEGFPLIRGDPVRVVGKFRTVHVSLRGRRIAGPVQFNYRCPFPIILYAAN